MSLQCACLLAIILTVRGYNQCHTKVYEVPGNVVFPVILSVRHNIGPKQCGNISISTLQHVIALKYAFGKLNQVDSNGNKFIPGVNLGFTVYDDCGDEDIASSHAYEILAPKFPRKITLCENADSQSVIGGVIGTSQSSTTDKVSMILKHSGWPVITVGGTKAAFSNKTRYPNLLRTVSSDEHQIKAIVSLIKKLNWTHFAVLHTTGSYGEQGAEEIRRLSQKQDICVTITKTISISSREDQTMDDIFESLKSYVNNGNVGMVYIGQKEAAEFVLQTAANLQKTRADFSFLKYVLWIMTDNVGIKAEVLKDEHLADGMLTIARQPIGLTEFLQFAKEEIRNGSTSDNSWIRTWSQDHCASGNSCIDIFQDEYVDATLDAVYTLVTAVRNAILNDCSSLDGLCKNMTGDLQVLKELRALKLNYSSMDASRFPPEFAGRFVHFDDNGDIVHSPESPLYEINMFWEGAFQQVGFYNRSGMHLIVDKLRQRDSQTSLRVSRYLGNSLGCHKPQPFIYVPGEVLIIAFFSVHKASKTDPFGCGAARTITNVIPSIDAFLHLIRGKLEHVGGHSFGVVIFDDCYNSLRGNDIVLEFLSGKRKLTDERTGDVINPKRIVAAVGPGPTSVTLPLTHSLTKLRLPQVSYSSSTPDLDERSLYPFFLRTVPSDDIQASVMVNIVKSMGWKHINVIFTNNNYGLKGMKKILEFAKNNGICVAEPIPISENPDNNLNSTLEILKKNAAKIIVFIGIDSSVKSLLQSLKDNNVYSYTFVACEDWGVNDFQGLELAAAGSLTVTIDTSKFLQNDFYEYMISKTPSKTDINPWFVKFWEERFKCNIPWTFNNKYSEECNPDLRLENQMVELITTDQRVVHTMNSIAAVVYGLASVSNKSCGWQKGFTYDKFRHCPDVVAQSIKKATLNDGQEKFWPFHDNGNGNIGFRIHNLQRKGNGDYFYKQVGQYSEKLGFRIDLDEIQFYNGDEKRSPVDKLDAPCNGAKCCAHPPANRSPQEPTNPSSVKEWVILIIVCVLCPMVFGILIIQVVRFRGRNVRPVERNLTIENESSMATPESSIAGSRIADSSIAESFFQDELVNSEDMVSQI